MDTRDEVLLDYAWLDTQKLEFKLLIIASVLAMDNKAFLGTMEDVAQYLGIKNNRSNRASINQALSSLVSKKFIVRYNDKANIIIALSFDAKNNSKVIIIQRTWIEVIKNYKQNYGGSVAWETVLRVFIYLLGNCGNGAITYTQIASDLGIKSTTTISNAVNVLCTIDFGNMFLDKDIVRNSKVIDGKTLYQCLGTQYSIMVNFE